MHNILINCNGCPCLNNDEETGINCNLGYTTRYEKFPDDKWYEFSDNCELIEIRIQNKSIHPAALELANTETDKAILIGGTHDGILTLVPNPPAPYIRIAILTHLTPHLAYFSNVDGIIFTDFDLKTAGKVTYEVYNRGKTQPRIYFYSHTETIP